MFPFWDLAIAPVIEAVRASRLVEIGALRGETTILMLQRLGTDAEVHVIDPVPEFDPAEHEKKFPGRYIFHRDLSLNVLPKLPPVDVALVDGDHNWYTVYNELKQLAEVARKANKPLPVFVMHDVCWPYGRRDLYYAPETIPEEFRQPYAQRGMRKGKKQLVGGGMNPTMCNALTEGGPRNGVMTALDDFVKEYGKPLRIVVLPIYFGLAIVTEEERLARQPELKRVLDYLESADGRLALMELAEDVRLNAMVFQHNVFYHRERQLEAAAARYLDLLKGTLLDEHYLEQELRISLLVESHKKGALPDPNKLRDPMRQMRNEMRALQAARRAGQLQPDPDAPAAYFPYTAMGRVRLDHLQQSLDKVRSDNVQGDLVEVGTGRGGGGMFMRGWIAAHDLPERKVWIADLFRSAPEEPVGSREYAGGPGFPAIQPDLNTVRDGYLRLGLLDDRVHFLVGAIADTLPEAPIEKVALLRIGAELAGSVDDALDALYDKVAIGGVVVIDGCKAEGRASAVEKFRSRRGISDQLVRVDDAAVCWRKTSEATAPARKWFRKSVAARAPLAPPLPSDPVDLSVVVVFYNMKREAARTLHSLSRSYQQGVEDLDYEVIVVENGSDKKQVLGEEFVRSFGPEFRYVDLGAKATPSPVDALNHGIRVSRGEHVALMIDGAHVLTPGVLRFGMQGLHTYAPAMVATQQWYVGPGQQGDAMIAGYDQTFEDRLFDEIQWPENGYRLFDIGHFIGDRDWFDGIWESNCVFVPRKVLEQVGCFDEHFSIAGGGYANLELYERLGGSPDVTVATIIGEASFHQIHGGTTTNQTESDERRRRIASYTQDYAELRGRGFRGPGKPMHYVGAMRPHAIRTKARHRAAPNLFKKGVAGTVEGIPSQPIPIPESMRNEFIDAFWDSLTWQKTTWLGHTVEKPPTDLVAYQELLTNVKPDWIIETGTRGGGRALFFASVCELLDHGRVVSIDQRADEGRPQHPRVTYLTGNAFDSAVVEQVRTLVGSQPNAVVVLGSRGNRQRTTRELDAYCPMVPVGSYVIIEDTVLNGHPVWPTFGPGPMEAVKGIVNLRDDFAPDPTYERWGLTFNPNGFLKRLK